MFAKLRYYRYSPFGDNTWLTRLAKLVGKEKALELTQKIRIREGLEMDIMVIGRWLKERNCMTGISSIRSLLTNNEKRIICAKLQACAV
eukprot:scaffold1330_cov77-Skeletonema_marinoi.AAC.1